jgi:hypothetical protein
MEPSAETSTAVEEAPKKDLLQQILFGVLGLGS